MVVGADLRMVSLVVKALCVDFREGLLVLSELIVASILASSSGVAASAGSWVAGVRMNVHS